MIMIILGNDFFQVYQRIFSKIFCADQSEKENKHKKSVKVKELIFEQ